MIDSDGSSNKSNFGANAILAVSMALQNVCDSRKFSYQFLNENILSFLVKNYFNFADTHGEYS